MNTHTCVDERVAGDPSTIVYSGSCTQAWNVLTQIGNAGRLVITLW